MRTLHRPLGPRQMSVLSLAAALFAIVGCGKTDVARLAVPKPVPVGAYAGDLGFDARGALLVLDERGVGTVDRRGRVTDRRPLLPSGEVETGAALSTDGSRVLVFVKSSRSRLQVVNRSDRSVVWSAAAGTSRFEEDRAYWSADGSKALVETDGPLHLRDGRTGRLIRRLPHGARYLGRRPLSPDGSTLAMTAQGGVAFVDTRTGRRRVVRTGVSLDRPTWSDDGRSIAGGVGVDGVASTVIVDVASGRLRRLDADPGDELAWSPRGDQLAAYAVGRNDQGDAGVSVIDIRTGRSTLIARTGAREEQGRLTWSADGGRVAYVSPPGIPCAPEAGGGIC